MEGTVDRRVLSRKLDLMATVVITAYNNGSTLKQIAADNNCASNTVRNLLLRENVSLRKRGRQKNVISSKVIQSDTI